MLDTPQFRDRRKHVAASLPLDDGILIVGAGESIPLPENSDQLYPFRAYAEYFFLTGMECAGAVVAFDPQDTRGTGWISFAPRVTEDQRVWEGRSQPPGYSLEELPAWLQKRAGRPIAALGAPPPHIRRDDSLSSRVREALHHARRHKDAGEIELLRRVAAATAVGYETIRPLIRPGVSEREMQIELESGFFRGGGDRTGYATIAGTGPNAAVLHFSPTQRRAKAGEFVLIDAGAEIDRYVCDVTRTYVAGEPTAFQRDLYQLVRHAEERAIAKCRPGIEWRNVHLEAAIDMVECLVALGLMRGEPETLVERAAHLLFFPHGIGHMVGLGVRDASGVAPDRIRSTEPALRNLRCDLPLEAGYVMTVEPGIYFIPALLNDPVRREQFRDAVNWDMVDQHLEIGGVRIEDNVVVQSEGEPEILTAAIPKDL